MKYEYLLFNFLVVAGPVAFSFEKKVRFFRKWSIAFQAITAALVPFIIWDILVSGQHWDFNETFVTGIRIFGLPVEEFLFFLTVPFACLFVWEVFFTRQESRKISGHNYLRFIGAVFFVVAAVFLFAGYEYTGLIFIAVTLVMILDGILKTNLLQEKRSYRFLGVTTLFILVFNGYLTARPVVSYNESYMLGWRIFTIPVEDFFYGYALVFLTLIFYERLRRRLYG